jgi:hypothetical protein
MEMSSSILYDKNETKIIKLDNGNYNIFFSIENKNINLLPIINFSLIKLIYDLNQDICEKVNLENHDDNNGIITVIIKNMFKDLGLPQKYSCLQIIKSVQNNSVVFDLITKSGIKPDWIPSDVEIADITNIKFVCDASNSQHKVNFKCLINFKEEIDTSIFVQKVSIMIINKIINRLKQFIENVRI